MNIVNVIGGGLAGCEAALALAVRGVKVRLFEQKPQKFSDAHHSELFAELVCSNSLRSTSLSNAVGLLKQEMRLLNSLVMEAADAVSVPAGGALAVDREGFSQYITDKIYAHQGIEVIRKEAMDINPEEYTIIASGPLTSEALFSKIKELTGTADCYFYDAAAPIVSYESIDMNKAYKKARYGRGGDDYINCPMTKEQYDRFYEALVSAKTAELKRFEEETVFEGCMPVETMAKRGYQTLLFGPLKPVGLRREGESSDPYAVVQLRQDDKGGTNYNMVGFQTHLKFSEQKRVFSMIPGLENAEFMRYGVMHRNTYINSPALLDPCYRMRDYEKIFFAGQITGVEGYVESASSGLLAGIYLSRILRGLPVNLFSTNTAIGALGHYISNKTINHFQPMNINFGIMEQLGYRVKGKAQKNMAISERALAEVETMIKDGYVQ